MYQVFQIFFVYPYDWQAHLHTHTHNSVHSFRKNLDVFQLGEYGLSFVSQNITLQYLLALDVN